MSRRRWFITLVSVFVMSSLIFMIALATLTPDSPRPTPRPSTAPQVTTSASPAPVTSPTPQVLWTKQCPTDNGVSVGFCADFPNTIEHHVNESATSKTGQADTYVASLYVDGTTVCTTDNDPRCPISSRHVIWYSVSIIPSKHSDPWTALTMLNGGMESPRQDQIDGHLTARFDKGLYGGPEFATFIDGRVYYVAIDQLDVPAPGVDRFLSSVHFV